LLVEVEEETVAQEASVRPSLLTDKPLPADPTLMMQLVLVVPMVMVVPVHQVAMVEVEVDWQVMVPPALTYQDLVDFPSLMVAPVGQLQHLLLVDLVVEVVLTVTLVVEVVEVDTLVVEDRHRTTQTTVEVEDHTLPLQPHL